MARSPRRSSSPKTSTSGRSRSGRSRSAGLGGRLLRFFTPGGGNGGWIGRLARFGLVAGIWGLIVVGALFAWYAYDLPDFDDLYIVERKSSVTLKAPSGSSSLKLAKLRRAANGLSSAER